MRMGQETKSLLLRALIILLISAVGTALIIIPLFFYIGSAINILVYLVQSFR